MAAHEIRTPITVIKAQAQLAERFHSQGKLQGEILERTLKTFVQESDRLARLCNELLDIARIDSGCFEVHASKVEVLALLRKVLAKVQLRGKPDLHQFQLNGDVGSELWAEIDSDRMEQVLTNLLVNSVRYSPEGGTVRIDVSVRERQAIVSVSDEGLGIPSEKIGQIFERYFQAHQSGLKGPCGLGIGLYLCREIMSRMGGEIRAESEGPGLGSKFSVKIPLSGEGIVGDGI